MSNDWLHIPVEVKHREFHSRLILAALAVERGFRVLIGKDQMFRRLAPILPKGIMFDKSLGTSRHGKTKRYRRFGHKIVIHDEEATGYFGSPEHTIRTRMEDETLAFCTSWYCLNQSLLDDATSIFPQHADKFVLTGLMRTDSWRKKFIGFYDPQKINIEKSNDYYGTYNAFNNKLISQKRIDYIFMWMFMFSICFCNFSCIFHHVFAKKAPAAKNR